MKSKILSIFCMSAMFLTITACQNNEVVENPNKQDSVATCEIIESSEAFCEKAVESGIYTEYAPWEKAIDGTDVQVVLDRADNFDETFFEDKALIYLVDCSSGNSQCKYEGCEIEETNGKTILSIQMSYSTEMLLNKLHAYHVFFIMDKSEAEKLDDAELFIFERN